MSTIKPDAGERGGTLRRIKPARERNAFWTVVIGLVVVLFSAAWTVLWFYNVDGLPRFLGLIGVIILYAGAGIVVNAFRGGEEMRAFARGSTITYGTVLECHTETPGDLTGARETYHVTVRFDVDGHPWVLGAEVGEEIYASCWRGRPLSVRYADANPRVALLEGEW